MLKPIIAVGALIIVPGWAASAQGHVDPFDPGNNARPQGKSRADVGSRCTLNQNGG